jgi:formate hydrogenlyase subunit 4
MTILLWIIQLLFIPAISPLCIGVTRKIKAKFQNRKGASIIQPYRDISKLLRKDEVISNDASWIFFTAPYVLFGSTLVLGASIPLISSTLMHIWTGDLITVVALLALGTFFLALAGMDTGSAFGGFGSSREMLLASLTEGGLILSLTSLALMTGGTNLSLIAAHISSIPLPLVVPLVLALISFIISMLAETSRYPFDNPATHLELTMIHEAMILEYSGKRLALMEWASANKYAIFLALGSTLFFPWGFATTASLSTIALALLVLVIKILIGCALVATLESSIAKLRIFRLPDLLFTSFILGVIAIGLII